jgi:transcriptional/translational regulatory protein YebC/TACO1
MIQADVTLIPQTWVELKDEQDIKMMNRILDLLDEDDDVQEVYNNY